MCISQLRILLFRVGLPVPSSRGAGLKDLFCRHQNKGGEGNIDGDIFSQQQDWGHSDFLQEAVVVCKMCCQSIHCHIERNEFLPTFRFSCSFYCVKLRLIGRFRVPLFAG